MIIILLGAYARARKNFIRKRLALGLWVMFSVLKRHVRDGSVGNI